MAYERFIWNDLSTFDMDTARQDYAALFGWSFAGDESYDFASAGGSQSVAVFPMPQRFIDIKMPSFWMSYIRVQNLERTVEAAKEHQGAIVEIGPHRFDDTARIALVRDPSGAGFTLYEGPVIERAEDRLGAVARIYHHSRDIGLIEAFYGDLFGWRFEEVRRDPWPVFDIRHRDGALVARAEEVPKEIRGKFSYWMPCFAVASAADASATISSLGGTVFAAFDDGSVLAADRQGAHFMIQPVMVQPAAGNAQTNPTPEQPRRGLRWPFVWLAFLGLRCLWLIFALVFDSS
ncbi:VOC family protein [Pelagibius sp.]|uniref:VOC family protein n=1 Tax=Pelagibius sp. TaxID=1931238 RepID=UPI0026134466|nr:VOC family protein [Pelagibius sp.]